MQFKGKINNINYAKQKLIISPHAYLHSESEHDIAEPGKARKDMAMCIKQQKTVYEMDVTGSKLVKTKTKNRTALGRIGSTRQVTATIRPAL